MLIRGFPLLPALILWMVGVALAVPAVLYRGDQRSPETLKASGGFKALGTRRVSIEEHVYMFPKDTNLVSYSGSKDRCMFFTDDDGWAYAIDTAGITFTDAAAYIEANKARFTGEIKKKFDKDGNWSKDDVEWVTSATVPFTAIIGWKRVTGSNDGPWEKNKDYTGQQTLNGLQARGPGGRCSKRRAAAKAPATKPPATKPPATKPLANKPPATKPPATKPLANKPPATKPPATKPLANKPPATKPLANKPPATKQAPAKKQQRVRRQLTRQQRRQLTRQQRQQRQQ